MILVRSGVPSRMCCVAAGVVCALLSAGCSVSDRAKPISNTFLEDRDVTTVDSSLPFSHAWEDPKADYKKYTKVYFRSVSIDRLPPDAWKASSSSFMTSQDDYVSEAKLLAKYFLDQLNAEVLEYPDGPIKVTDKADEHTLVFDFAFTELEFSHPIQNTGALLVPVPGAAVLFSTISNPHVAMAGRVYDGKSGKLVGTLADRKYPPTRLLDFNKVTVTSPNREICTYWAEEIAEALERDGFTTVGSRGIFKLLPW